MKVGIACPPDIAGEAQACADRLCAAGWNAVVLGDDAQGQLQAMRLPEFRPEAPDQCRAGESVVVLALFVGRGVFYPHLEALYSSRAPVSLIPVLPVLIGGATLPALLADKKALRVAQLGPAADAQIVQVLQQWRSRS